MQMITATGRLGWVETSGLEQEISELKAAPAKSELNRTHTMDFYVMRCSELTQIVETHKIEIDRLNQNLKTVTQMLAAKAPTETQAIRRDADFHAMRAE